MCTKHIMHCMDLSQNVISECRNLAELLGSPPAFQDIQRLAQSISDAVANTPFGCSWERSQYDNFLIESLAEAGEAGNLLAAFGTLLATLKAIGT
jgi:hypothetical protein